MDLTTFLDNYKELRTKMMEEGVINETFLKLETIQDEVTPHFAFDMVDLFFTDAEQVLREINMAMDLGAIDLVKADSFVHRLKGCVCCLGVARMKELAEGFRTFYLQRSIDGCLITVQQINQEYLYCKERLQALKKIAEEIWAAGGTIPLATGVTP